MKSKETESLKEIKWQKKLLPVMIGVLVVLTIFFFVASFVQLYYLHTRIEKSPALDLEPALALLEKNVTSNSQQRLEYAKWKALAILEGHALQRRYHQTNVALMARIWKNYLGFVTGMILALVGAAFILGKLKEPKSKLDAESNLWKFSMTTASPGLLLALLGTILMITTIFVHTKIEVIDRPVYLEKEKIQSQIDIENLLDRIEGKTKESKSPAEVPEDIESLLDKVDKKIKDSKKTN